MKECCGTCKYLDSEYDIACTNCNPDCGESGYEPSEEFIEMERYAEIGKATELMFDKFEDIITIKYFEKEYEEQEELYVDADNSPIFNSSEDLLEWYRRRQTND